MSKHTLQTSYFPLVLAKDGARIDSRVIAAELDIENRALLQNIDNYFSHVEAFGVVTFQMQKPPKGSKGGMPVRIALLNENQAYFAATLSRNTARAVDVKFRLVKAFGEARQHQQTRDSQYLPFYHLAHEATRQMANDAANHGSNVPEGIFHANIERMINKAMGIEAGQRDSLDAAQCNAISTAYQLVRAAITDTLAANGGHDAAYQEAKRRVNDFVRLFRPMTERLSA